MVAGGAQPRERALLPQSGTSVEGENFTDNFALMAGQAPAFEFDSPVDARSGVVKRRKKY
jgi:hypothetical protein